MRPYVRVIGMISGTSFDAVEALLADIELDGDRLVCDLVEHRSVPYPPAVRQAISAILPPAPTTIEQVCRLDVAIGQFFAEVAKEPGGRPRRRGRRLLARPDRLPLGRRRRRPRGRCSSASRPGSPSARAPRWSATSATGTSPPAATARRWPACSTSCCSGATPARRRGSLNLGGIANVTVLGPGREPLAFDIGPSNALIDAAVEMLTDGRPGFDHDGAWAARGPGGRGPGRAACWTTPTSPCRRRSRPARSTSTSATSPRRLEGRRLTAEDLLASLTVATAEMVAAAVRAVPGATSSSWPGAVPATPP